MPISKIWSNFTKAKVSLTTNGYGVYELGDTSKNVHYIGQGRIYPRLDSHFIAGSDPIPGTKYFRHDHTGSKERAEQRERALLRDYERAHGRLPKYNQRRG